MQAEINSSVHKKHGKRKERLYGIWQSMKTRCTNEKHKYFQNYGGRGISVCSEWENFEPFYKWAVTHVYSVGLTIDRIDNDGNYCPENCRWATSVEQTRNRKNTIKIQYHGTEKTLMEVAKIEGITYTQAYRKYRKK